MKFPKSLILVFLMAVVLAACGAAGNTGTPESETATAMDYASFVTHLEETGFQVEETGVVSQPFTSAEGKTLTVNGDEMQVFEYSDQSSAEAQVTAFKDYFDTTMIMWIAPPHFYQTGKIIVLYLGENAEIIQALEAIAGAQFAGQ